MPPCLELVVGWRCDWEGECVRPVDVRVGGVRDEALRDAPPGPAGVVGHQGGGGAAQAEAGAGGLGVGLRSFQIYLYGFFLLKNPIIWDFTAAMLSTVVMQKQQLNWNPKATEPGKGVSQEVT